MPGWGVGDLLKDIELDPLVQGLIIQLNHVCRRITGTVSAVLFVYTLRYMKVGDYL